MSNPHIDNIIDTEVDRVLAALNTSTPEEFKQKFYSLSPISRKVVVYMVKEQIAVEGDPVRKSRLEHLESTITDLL